jgi:hypothetical protein
VAKINGILRDLSIYNQRVVVHPTINSLKGSSEENAWGETEPITKELIDKDDKAEELFEPVTPENKYGSNAIANAIENSNSNLPTRLQWISSSEFAIGTIVETENKIFQIDDVENHSALTGVYVYRLRGDDTIA